MNCFHFTDYIQIHTITLHEDLISMDGAYQDPVTGKLKFTYFEAYFDYIYNLLASNEHFDSEKAIEAMSRTLVEKVTDEMIDLGENFIQLHDMVFRLTTMVEEGSNEEPKHAGYFIEDAHFLEEGSISYQQYLKPIDFSQNNRNRRVQLHRAHKNMSGYLVVLALRYEYHRSLLRYGLPLDRALYLASLPDEIVLAAAKAASQYINLNPDVIVVHKNSENHGESRYK